MAEAVMNSLDQVVGPVKQSGEEDPNLDGVTSLFDRRIEFHVARKPFKGFGGEGNNGFKLETLNPGSTDNTNSSELQQSFSGGVSGFGRVLKESSYGLDPELGFRITFRRIGAGLQNLGNTCFLNSVLQCLTYTEPLAAYLQSGRHKISCRIAGFCALCAIQRHVSRALESTGRILVPKDLVSNLRCISRNFRNARQEDAHEYMVNLLESMHKCCLPSGVPSESPSAYEKSLVHKIFGGRLRSQVKCLQCSFCSNKFDPFLDLSLEIVKADSLYAALANFTAKEQLDGGERQYQCQQCKQKVRALKQLTVYKAPEVLTVHLKRFASHAPGVKIDKRIDFRTTLDLKPFVTGPNDGDLKYTLYGVLVHAGWSTHSGHYFCFVRTSSGMWYSLDDNQVVQVSEARVLQQKAYMLFYVRDRRHSAPKKAVDVIRRENLVLNALGNRACNNFKLGSKEPNMSESKDKKLNVSVSTPVPQRGAFDTNPLKKNDMKTASGLRVDGPSGNTNLSEVPISAVTESVNGTGPNDPSKCSSIKKGHSSEPVVKVPVTNSENILSLDKPVDVGCSDQKVLTASVDVENCNKLQSSAKKNPDTGVHGSSTSSVDRNTGKDQKGALSDHLDSAVLNRCSTDASLLSKTKTIEGGGFSEVAGVNGSGQEESKISEPGLSCEKSEESKLKVAKKKSLRCHATRLHLSSSIIFGAGLARKKKHRKRKRHFMSKVDEKSVLSDSCPSASKKSKIVQSRCSNQSSRGDKHVFNGTIDTSIKLNEDGEVPPACVVGENLGKTVQQSCSSSANLLLQKTSAAAAATEKIPDSRESRGSGGVGTVDVETNFNRVAIGDLKDRKIPGWDVQEPGPLDCGEPRSADSMSIGYVADEWDEEYDRGKRKKVKTSKVTFGGPNPFQELASKKSKRKKPKVKHYRSSTHPFRI